MTVWPQRLVHETALKQADAMIAVTPEAVETRFKRACLLVELGRTEDAISAFLDVLKKEPTHFGALTNFGNLLYATGFKTAARTLYTEAVKQYPENPKGHVNLANLLADVNETASAMQHFEIALQRDPEHMEAHRGLANLLTVLGDGERAAIHRQKGFGQNPVMVLPYYGEAEPVRLLVLASAVGGTVSMQSQFDARIFLATILFVEYYNLSTPLPPHQLLVNAIGDADICKTALEMAIKIVARTTAPVINQPSDVLLTGRLENAKRLAHIQDVITPKMALLPRTLLQGSDAATLLASYGFVFPLLLRSPGFHTGRFFVCIENEYALAENLRPMPGQELLVIEYLDARSRDGKIRKYRVMMIDGVLYPLHVAISHEWKVHYFTAEMADNDEHRAEDAAFLEDMARVLGERAMGALEKICKTLRLDYGGVDFGLSNDGKIILFEANATMVVNPPDDDARWAYRRPAVQNVLDAIRRLLTK